MDTLIHHDTGYMIKHITFHKACIIPLGSCQVRKFLVCSSSAVTRHLVEFKVDPTAIAEEAKLPLGLGIVGGNGKKVWTNER